MEIADIIRWICLAFAFIAALFSVLIFVSLRNPKTFMIRANEEFANNLYEDFAERLTTDPAFVSKAMEAMTAQPPAASQ